VSVTDPVSRVGAGADRGPGTGTVIAGAALAVPADADPAARTGVIVALASALAPAALVVSLGDGTE